MTDQKGNKKLRSLLISCGLILVGFALMLIVLSVYVLNLLNAQDADLDTPLLKIKATSYVRELLFTHDGQGLLSLEHDHNVYLRNISDGKIIQRFKTDGERINNIALHPSKPWLAASVNDGVVWLWDYQTGEVLNKLSMPVGSTHIAFSPNGEYLAADVWDYFAKQNYTGRLFIWQVADFSLLHEIELQEMPTNIAFTYDSQNLITITGVPTVAFRIWDVSSGTMVKEPSGFDFRELTWSARLSHNTPTMFLYISGLLESWNQQGDYLGQFATQPNSICSIVMSNDSQHLATGSCIPHYQEYNTTPDKAIRILNVVDASLYQEIKAHNSHIWALAFSPDGTLIASGSDDKTIKIWRVAPDTAAP
jgi:WD40 repeat protein